jgi:choline-sulfatase
MSPPEVRRGMSGRASRGMVERRLAALLVIAWGCAGLAGCSPDAAPKSAADKPAAGATASAPAKSATTPATPGAPPAAAAPGNGRKLPNIVVYLVDTLRADRLGLYGNTRDTSPSVDALGAKAAVFDHASSQAPWTLPSVTSLFTGTYPTTHEVLSNFDKLGPQAETLVEFMHAQGYHTVGFVANTLGGTGAGLDQGYDEFHQNKSVHDLTPEEIAAGALSLEPLYDWAKTYDWDQPVFLYVHTVEPHNPWTGVAHGAMPWFKGSEQDRQHLNDILPEQRGLLADRNLGRLKPGAAERLAALTAEIEPRVSDAFDLYDGNVRQANDNIHRFINLLIAKSHWESTIVVFLADHGDELYEHGNWFHGQSLFEELLHVPLIVRIPGVTDDGMRLAQPVQVIDVPPTLADALGVPPLDTWQGRSLLPLLRATHDGTELPAAPPVFSMRINVDRKLGGERGDRETALREDNWKLIVHWDSKRTSLFDLATDPGETHDLTAEQPERLKTMLEAVNKRLHDLPKTDLRAPRAAGKDMDEEKKRDLQALGYLDGEGKSK